MSRSRLIFFVLSLVLVTTLVGGHWLADDADDGEESLYKYLSTFTEVLDLVRQAYVDQTDMDQLVAGALDGATDALDPFSLYVPADEVEPYLAARETGDRLSGLTLLKERGIAYVVSVAPGSPADQAGIRPGDVVTTLDGASTRDMPLWSVQERLAGNEGERIVMELIRLGEELEVSFELHGYEAPLASLESVERDGATAGVLQLGRFRDGTVERVRTLLAEAAAAGHDRLLVDLRNVAEGDPRVAYEVAALLTGGELGQLVQRDSVLSTFNGEDEPVWDGKLVVLINRGTLGAAEVLATVLRQNAGAELVGEQTFGYAGRQDSAELSSGGQLFFTDAFYTGPDGEPLSEAIEPDEKVDFFSRHFEERDLPIHELIYRRGLDRLFGEAEAALDRAA
ncbi:MAG TPA: S41 family peptidase [Thermoanaerobaculia bacterium]|nr:S41 family peptidase [Thermoanaerobaculia bacterium]